MVDKRNYTIYWSVIGFKGGSYKSANPTSAAKKAGNRLFKLANDDKKYTKYKSTKSIKFVIRETTRGSAHNIYTYIATRTKLKVPKVVTIAGKEIVYNFTIDVVPGSLNKQESKIVGGNPDMLNTLNGLQGAFSSLMDQTVADDVVLDDDGGDHDEGGDGGDGGDDVEDADNMNGGSKSNKKKKSNKKINKKG
jgi:hypothetical protein